MAAVQKVSTHEMGACDGQTSSRHQLQNSLDLAVRITVELRREEERTRITTCVSNVFIPCFFSFFACILIRRFCTLCWCWLSSTHLRGAVHVHAGNRKSCDVHGHHSVQIQHSLQEEKPSAHDGSVNTTGRGGIKRLS